MEAAHVRLEAMASKEPWFCEACRIKVRANANYCSQCGRGWTYAPPASSQPWNAWQPGGWQAPASPRRRQWDHDQQPPKGQRPKGGHSPRRRRQGKAGKGDEGGQAKAAGKGSEVPRVPQISNAPAPPSKPVPAVPAGASSAGASGTTDPALQQLLSALNKSRDDLPQSVRELLDSQVAEDSKVQAKTLHKLVAAQSQARRQLAATKAMRQDYTREWANYVSGLCTMWQEQLAEKARVFASFLEAEGQWEQQLLATSQQLARSAADPDQQEPIDVDSMEEEEAQIDELARLDTQRQIAVDSMLQAEAKITASLQEAQEAVKQQAEAMVKTDRERSPRRRKETPKESVKEEPPVLPTAMATSQAGAKPPQ